MPTIFLKHTVEDFDVWRSMYQQDVTRRDAAGLKEIGVFRDPDQGKTVLIVLEAEDLSTVKALLDPALMTLMREAGVVNTQVWLAEVFGRHIPLSFRGLD